jgi:hypothetical protein
MWMTFEKYYKILDDLRLSVYVTCMKFDVPFNENDYEGMVKQLTNNPESHPFKIYMTKTNSLGSVNNSSLGFDPKYILEKDPEMGKVESILEDGAKGLLPEIRLDDEDKRIKEDVLRLIGYDPFSGYSEFDQKFLYNELVSYLDEDTLDDAFKLSQILQLVNNNNQIRKIDLVIATLSEDGTSLIANQGDIKSLSETKSKIVLGTDKIAKENSISVKNRGDKTAGKSTLTYMMRDYRELGFEYAEQDYYDQKKAHGIKITADISNKSILEQLQFDENDINDIFFTQRDMVQKLQAKVDDLEEEIRQLHASAPKKKGR